jgi:hypothetical protein
MTLDEIVNVRRLEGPSRFSVGPSRGLSTAPRARARRSPRTNSAPITTSWPSGVRPRRIQAPRRRPRESRPVRETQGLQAGRRVRQARRGDCSSALELRAQPHSRARDLSLVPEIRHRRVLLLRYSCQQARHHEARRGNRQRGRGTLQRRHRALRARPPG